MFHVFFVTICNYKTYTVCFMCSLLPYVTTKLTMYVPCVLCYHMQIQNLQCMFHVFFVTICNYKTYNVCSMCSLLPYVTTKLTLYGPDKSNNLLEYNYIIVIDMEGNIRIFRLPKGRGTDQYHDPRAVCLS
jgi:hypothetical protein